MVTFTPGEMRKLRRVAGGTRIGTYIRELVLRHLARRRK